MLNPAPKKLLYSLFLKHVKKKTHKKQPLKLHEYETLRGQCSPTYFIEKDEIQKKKILAVWGMQL